MSAWVCGNCTAAYSVGAPQCPQCGARDPRVAADAPSATAITVRCPGLECEAYGVQRLVPVRLAAPGVVERPPLHCAACGRAVEVVQDEEKEDDMPKVSVHEGPSNAADLPADDSADEGEESSPTSEEGGGTSSASSKKEPTSPETSETATPKPARKTGSRSGRAPTGSSTAPGTDGDPTAPTSDGSEG